MRENKKEKVDNNKKSKNSVKKIAQQGIIKICALIAIVSMLMATCGTLIYYLINK